MFSAKRANFSKLRMSIKNDSVLTYLLNLDRIFGNDSRTNLKSALNTLSLLNSNLKNKTRIKQKLKIPNRHLTWKDFVKIRKCLCFIRENLISILC